MFGRILFSFYVFVLSGVITTTASSRQSCDHLVHIGDSTSLTRGSTLRKSYKDAGFSNVHISALNGRAIIHKTISEKRSGIEEVNLWRSGLDGQICWVIALGTNDASSPTSPSDEIRINKMMEAIAGDPVMWVNIWMDSQTRPSYSVAASNKWNKLLSRTVSKYPNASVYNWAFVAKTHPEWFVSDGFHYNGVGSISRYQSIARAASLIFSN